MTDKTEEKQDDYRFKIVIIGDSDVGKTNLLTRYITKKYATIWDTAGQERFANIARAYVGAHGIFLVFDVTDYNSFENLPKRLKECEKTTGDCVKMLIGNKNDLRRCISKEEAENLQKSMGYIISIQVQKNLKMLIVHLTK
eukprot:gene11850-5179_t